MSEAQIFINWGGEKKVEVVQDVSRITPLSVCFFVYRLKALSDTLTNKWNGIYTAWYGSFYKSQLDLRSAN